MINKLNNAWHNWSLEFFFTCLIGADDVKSIVRVIRGSETEFWSRMVIWRPGSEGILMQNGLLEGSWWFFWGRKGLWKVKNCLCLCNYSLWAHSQWMIYGLYANFNLSWPLHLVTNLKAKLKQTAKRFASGWLVPLVSTWPTFLFLILWTLSQCF